MEVVKVKKITNNYQLTFDDNSLVMVNDDLLIKHRLLVGSKVDDRLYEELTIFSDNLYFYQRAVKYINTKLRSIEQVRDYLKKLEAINPDSIIKNLQNEGYLNDLIYAKAYVNDRVNLSSDGPIKIRTELVSNKIEDSIINNLLFEIGDEVWLSKCQKIINKKLKTVKPTSKNILINKLKEYLFNLGYPSNIVNELLNNIDYDNNVELDKFLNKLNKKYTEEEKIKKAQSAGFNYYDIVAKLKS